MIGENVLDKSRLVSELRKIHIELVEVYKNIFDYKYRMDKDFKTFIDGEHKENRIKDKEKQAWNDNFCHRASYTLLNKILFVRICEDKGFMLNPEDYVLDVPKDPHIGQKLSRKGLQKWANLVTNYTLGELVRLAFLDMKKSYSNIILYKDDRYKILNFTTEQLSLKFLEGNEEVQNLVLEFEDVLNRIVEKLDTNKFNFKNADGSILGDVYENFMDRETRKAMGQFYTPEFVIEYILKNTVAEADVVENPFVSVADISCGSGHFLIMAYDILREKFISNLELLGDKYADEVYTIERHGDEEELSGNNYWKEENIHYHLLKHCIYGADIDSFAVQLTTINLLLKDLDNFTDELNIIECDSLIKWEEDYDWKDLKEQLYDIRLLYTLRYRNILGIEQTEEVNRERAEEIISICEFWGRKYDYIVGNPPYVSFGLRNVGKLGYSMSDYLRANYTNSAEYKISYYALFFERAINRLKKLGRLGFVTPDSFLLGRYFSKIRRYILNKCNTKKFTLFNDKVFDGATIGTATISIFERKKYQMDNNVIVKAIENDQEISYSYSQYYFEKMIYNRFRLFFNERDFKIINYMDSFKYKVSNFANIKTGMRSLTTQKDIKSYKKEGPTWRKGLVSSAQVKRWEILYDGDWLDVNPKKLYGGGWEKDVIENDKILIRQTGDSLIAAIDRNSYYHLNNCHSISLKNNTINLEYLLCILNSKLMNYYYHKISLEKGRVMAQLDIETIEKLPIVVNNWGLGKLREISIRLEDFLRMKRGLYFDIDSIDTDILKAYEEYCSLLKGMDEKINDIKNEINDIVYQIYGFKEIDIKYIENLENKHKSNSALTTFDNINKYIIKYIICKIKTIDLNTFFTVSKLREKLPNYTARFNEIIEIMREERPNRKTTAIIKDIINSDSYTWNAYRKAKKSNKINKTFIKYYDNNYYGLAEWPDEIHKNYFLDAIEKYTVDNPNEKKAKDILKLFKDLDIEDKRDYIEIIKGKIKKAFN